MESRPDLATLKKSSLVLKDDCIRLRLLCEHDLPTTLDWRNQDDMRFNFIHSDIINWDSHLVWFKQYLKKEDDFVFIIEDISVLKRAIGQISIYNIDLNKKEAEYGRLMIGDSEARGKGLARRATKLLLDWVYKNLGIETVYIEVLKQNKHALDFDKKTGFRVYAEDERLIYLKLHRDEWLDTDKQ